MEIFVYCSLLENFQYIENSWQVHLLIIIWISFYIFSENSFYNMIYFIILLHMCIYLFLILLNIIVFFCLLLIWKFRVGVVSRGLVSLEGNLFKPFIITIFTTCFNTEEFHCTYVYKYFSISSRVFTEIFCTDFI